MFLSLLLRKRLSPWNHPDVQITELVIPSRDPDIQKLKGTISESFLDRTSPLFPLGRKCNHRIGKVSNSLFRQRRRGQDTNKHGSPAKSRSQSPRDCWYFYSSCQGLQSWRRPSNILVMSNLSRESPHKYRSLVSGEEMVERCGTWRRGHF